MRDKNFSLEFRSFSTQARKFLAQTGWDRPRKRKKKFWTRILFRPNPSQKIPKKIAKKIQKIKKVNSGFISIQKGLREAEKERKKILIPNFVPTQP